MKFKNVKTLSLLLAAAVMSLTSCNEQQLTPDVKPDLSGKTFYLSGALALPSTPGTRSATDDPDDDTNPNKGTTNSTADPDYEYGHNYENSVHTMILVFAKKADNGYITHSVVTGINAVPTDAILQNQFNFTLKAELQYDDLKKAYEKEGNEDPIISGENNTVNVFAFCNFNDDLRSKFAELKDSGTGLGSTEWLDWAGTSATPIWGKNQFLMTNAKIVEVKFPKTIEEWDPYSHKDNPWYLNQTGDQPKGTVNADTHYNPIKVERAAARLDFKDGSGNNNTYPLDYDFLKKVPVPEKEGEYQEEVETKNLVSIQLTEMSLVNMSKNFYYLRRVSANGMPNAAVIGGAETGYREEGSTIWKSNYVVDTDAKRKQTVGGYTPENADGEVLGEREKGGFDYPLFTTDTRTKGKIEYNEKAWNTAEINDVLTTGDSDTWDGGKGADGKYSYHIWRYVTENTIPEVAPGDYSQQKTVQSTGIVFKGQIQLGEDAKTWQESYAPFITEAAHNALTPIDPEDDEYSKRVSEKPLLFSYNNGLYAGIADLAAKAEAVGEGDPLYVMMNKIFKNWKKNATDGKYVFGGTGEELTVKEFNENPSLFDDSKDMFSHLAATTDPDYGISTYRPDEKGNYWCYYFYWNRHNDNGNPGEMGPMEFCVVRNNVYKLSVTSIDRIGHPTNPDDDPDPVDPEDPDEERVRYCAVKVEVLPWVVRVNEIQF